MKVKIFRASDLHSSSAESKTSGDVQPRPIGFGTANPVQLGKYLYVLLAVARPLENDYAETRDAQTSAETRNGTFPSDELLAYDIEFTAQHDYGKEREEQAGSRSDKNRKAYSWHSQTEASTSIEIIH